MKYEHLVRINAPHVKSLTRDQLWRGLMHRVEQPHVFLPHIDRVEILDRGEDFIERVMWFGDMEVRDRIAFDDGVRFHYHTLASEAHAGGHLTVSIEEPDAGELFVRFCYETPLAERVEDGVDVGSYLRSAWQQSDTEAMQKLRELAASGAFDAGPDASGR